MNETARLVLAVDSTDVDKADGKLNKLGKRAGKTERETRKLGRATDQLKGAYRGLGAVLTTIGAGLLIREVVKASDTYTELRSQLKLVTDDQQELNAVWQESYDLANDTRGSLEGTVQLYAKLARSTEQLDLANKDLFTITKAINQSFVVSGASAQEAEGAIRQLAQGMASGTLRGDELNSVMENSPRLARAIADGLGVTIGELRQLGADGQITAQAITTALLSTASSIDREFQQMPRTVGQALQQLQNDLLVTFGQTDTTEFVTAIDELRKIVTDPGFQQSMVTLGSAVAKLAGFLAEATTEGIKFTKWAAEELAARYNGVANDDIIRLEEQAQQIRDQLDGGLFASLDRVRFFGENGVVEWWSEDELRGALTAIEKQIAEARKRQEEKPSAGAGAGNDGDSGGGSVPPLASGPSEKELKAQEDAMQSVIDAAWARTEAIKAAKEAEAEYIADEEMALQAVRESLYSQEDLIEASYERRRQIILDNTVVTEEERTRIEKELAEQRNNQLAQLERARASMVMSASADLFGGLASLTKAFGDKQSGNYKTLFAVSKGFAITDASLRLSMALAQAVADPSALTLPQKLANYAAVASTMGNLVNQVSSIQYQGSFDGGGYTGNGVRSGGIDGKGGFPAILHPQETVVDHSKGQGMGANVTVNMVEDASRAGQVEKQQTDEGMLITAFVSNIRNDGAMARTLEQTYGIKRIGS